MMETIWKTLTDVLRALSFALNGFLQMMRKNWFVYYFIRESSNHFKTSSYTQLNYILYSVHDIKNELDQKRWLSHFPALDSNGVILDELEFWLVDRFGASLPLYELWPKLVAPWIIHNSDILNASTYFFYFPLTLQYLNYNDCAQSSQNMSGSTDCTAARKWHPPLYVF